MSSARAATIALALALLIAAMCLSPAEAAVRSYFIAADEVVWNYAPGGQDQISGGRVPPLPPSALGWRFRKVIYRAYTDASFTTLASRPASDAYQGLLGPTMRAVVGDTIAVRFKNNSRLPAGIAVAGLSASPSGAVAPGANHTYTWHVTASAGPGAMDGTSVAWRYHCPVDENRDENTGMIGTVIVTRRGSAKADGSPSDVDREVPVLFTEMNESQSRLVDANIADPAINPRHLGHRAPNFVDDNAFFAIDGYSYGTMPMVTVREGERTRWYVIVTRSGFDAHVPHWHGETLLQNGMRTDAFQVQVDEIAVADMVPDNPGIWLFHCHIHGHLAAGMEARFKVVP
ncbi:MAG: copper oxidase [Candidatus Eremiobacter antarcticus]|nr:multicopper oxidase domain-containing protein [Candidatus Eremiobacteraeota bacterium]MBC5807220.1 multicopper oxidase domain-containing protein [Candidatus Eremiobacteraeota bacterium]PZR61903.1 MAG: copper oxidase [Candidatus Eremiobacter sp. RRmetagenome_bin22]